MAFRMPFLHMWLLCCLRLLLEVSAYTKLSDESLRILPRPGADFDIHNGALLAPLLIPRVPGTPGSTKVQQHFIDFFTTQLPAWKIEYQNSTGTTPATGDRLVPFVNLIMTRDPPWTELGDVGRLTLVAHYDSKLTPEGFIGATDSAAPCAMIMHAARSVDAALTKRWEFMAAQGLDDGLQEEVGLQILFLDGEEAFLDWTATDSLYGARYELDPGKDADGHPDVPRSLAETWESTFHPALSTYRTALSSITLFMLLDLLGSATPNVPSFYRTTHWAYQNLATNEQRLRDLSLLASSSGRRFLPDLNKDPSRFGRGFVEDDHIPFLKRGVEILHLIPLPFPNVWHTIDDDGEHLDMATTEDWAVIVTAFVAEWMDLEGYLDTPVRAQSGDTRREAPTSKTEFIAS